MFRFHGTDFFGRGLKSSLCIFTCADKGGFCDAKFLQPAPAAVAHQGGSEQATAQQPGGSQQSASSSQGAGAQQPGGSSQATITSGTSTQASEPQSANAGTARTPGMASGVLVQAQSLHQQQQVQTAVLVLVTLDTIVDNEIADVQDVSFSAGRTWA